MREIKINSKWEENSRNHLTCIFYVSKVIEASVTQDKHFYLLYLGRIIKST